MCRLRTTSAARQYRRCRVSSPPTPGCLLRLRCRKNMRCLQTVRSHFSPPSSCKRTQSDGSLSSLAACRFSSRFRQQFSLKHMAAKAAFTWPQQKGGLGLGQSTLAPALIDFLKSHLAVLLHEAGPANGGVLHRSSTNRTDYLLRTGQPIYSRQIANANCSY